MSKVFISGNLFKKPWFRKLDPDLKLFWIYCISNCDVAGIMDIDLEVINIILGVELTEVRIKSAFKDKLIFLCGYKIYLSDYVLFQQNINSLEDLNPSNNCHKGIINRLKKHSLYSLHQEDLARSSQGPSQPLARTPGNVMYGNGKGKDKGNKENVENSDAEGKQVVNQFIELLTADTKTMTRDQWDFYNGWKKYFGVDHAAIASGSKNKNYLPRKKWVAIACQVLNEAEHGETTNTDQ